jgi:hypothetical protein
VRSAELTRVSNRSIRASLERAGVEDAETR